MISDKSLPLGQLSDGWKPLEWKLPSSRKGAVVCLITTETGLFSIFVAAYLFYLGRGLTGPTPRDGLELPVLSTICLLSSSITMTLAERAFSRDRVGLFKRCCLATIGLAA